MLSKLKIDAISCLQLCKHSNISIKGGNINDDEVHPGVAIYFKGADIGAVVSTGTWTWKVEVQGQRPLSGKLF